MRILGIVLLAVLTGCATPPRVDMSYSPTGVEIIRNLEASDAHRTLQEMGEPSVVSIPDTQSNHVYRLTWRRSFDPPVVVRLDMTNPRKATLHVKRIKVDYSKPVPVYLGLDIDRRSVMTINQLNNFFRFLLNARFWDVPTVDPHLRGTDGASWIVEGLRDGKYHVIERQSPISDHDSSEYVSKPNHDWLYRTYIMHTLTDSGERCHTCYEILPNQDRFLPKPETDDPFEQMEFYIDRYEPTEPHMISDRELNEFLLYILILGGLSEEEIY